MTNKAVELEIIKLWSSVFLEKDVPDYEEPTQRLVALAERGSSEGVFTIEDPGVAWLKHQIAHAVGAYLRKAGYLDVPQWGARGQFAVHQQGDFRPLANQPGAQLAGMYVLSWPSQHDHAGERDDRLPGYVSFYDPRVAMNMNAIKRDPYHGYHRSLKPRAGLLLLWPAHISYFVHPNFSAHPAMRVAFDVLLHSEAPKA